MHLGLRTRNTTRVLIVVGIFLLTVIGFFLARDTFARLAWEKYHQADLALTLDQKDAMLAVSIGGYYFNVNGSGTYDLKQAESAYEKAIAIDPAVPWGHYQLARIYFVNGDFKNALDNINESLTVSPDNLRALYIRGLIYGYRDHQGDLDLAAADLRRFTAWKPNEWAGYNDLVWILLRQKKYEDAVATLEEALKKATGAEENPWLWNNIGIAKLNLGEYEGAHEAFLQAQTLAEKLSDADWRAAYPGNDPTYASDGLTQFKKGIADNLKKSAEHLK